MVKKGKSRRMDERIAWPERQMTLTTSTILIRRVFLYTSFQRMQLCSQNGRVSIVDIEEILLFNVVGLVLRTGFEDGCFEHVPPAKSGEDNH